MLSFFSSSSSSSKQSGQVTFSVSKVEPVEGRKPQLVGAAVAMKAKIQRKGVDRIEYSEIETTQDPKSLDFIFEECECVHSLVLAIHTAYDLHLPLVLRADHIWLVILQSFAAHIDRNHERYRSALVAHKGKKEIEIENPTLVPGENSSDWRDVPAAFSERIRHHVNHDMCGFLFSDFSTTTSVSRTASEISVMYALQNYFVCTLQTYCGIPQITLVGTPDDFWRMKQRVQLFSEFGLSQWAEALQGVLTQLERTAAGDKPNLDFWQQIYKLHGGSGGEYISGWVNVLFPHKKDGTENPCAFGQWDSKPPSLPAAAACSKGILSDDIPVGISMAPFTWHYHPTISSYRMYLAAGFVGVSYDQKSGAIEPHIGWAAVHRRDNEKEEIKQVAEPLEDTSAATASTTSASTASSYLGRFLRWYFN